MSGKNKTKLFVFHYKPGEIIASKPEYVHIWVGKNGAEKQSGFTDDDVYNNISNKNKYFSELTGLYWVWKNTKSEIVGSCHYRRYFTTSKLPLSHKFKQLFYYPTGLLNKRHGLIYTNNLKYWKPKILSEKEVASIFENFDAILPVARKLKYSIEEHYSRYHNIDDLRLVEKILKAKYPGYIESFKTVLQGNRLFANNMFVLKRKTFDELMEWLFSILFKFEEEITLTGYSGYQERIFGFLSERLITVWIIHNKINYKELQLLYFKKLKSQFHA